MRRGPSGLVLLALLSVAAPAMASTTRAALGLEYDDNPFERAFRERAGWVTRFYLSTDTRLLDRSRASIDLQHHCGLKRYWRRDPAAREAGDVLVNQLEVGGLWRLMPRLLADGRIEMKLKNVQRISSEESYLRAGLRLAFVGQWPGSVSTRLDYRQAGDDARDSVLVDLGHRELGARVRWRRRRALAIQAGLRWHWLDYDRRALGLLAPDGLVEGAADQRDQLRECHLGIQFYARILANLGYSFAGNSSNSLGYAYRAHRVHMMLSGHLHRGVDAHLYATAQLRDYTDDLVAAASVDPSVQDEYEQTMLSLRLTRQLTARCGLSCQYQWARNGSRGSGQYYRKSVYAFAVETEI